MQNVAAYHNESLKALSYYRLFRCPIGFCCPIVDSSEVFYCDLSQHASLHWSKYFQLFYMKYDSNTSSKATQKIQ
ncbi:hypothetical protein T05_15606 [Trichinella murrelli]|uniref:Uncharacterized protein n=1 Tax=Trichinella murrelli TaxID=144512 RepID=A0A0V0TKQ1_9BILA|nr:hypothetical protein T05_15606 [Trichinella murrelli]